MSDETAGTNDIPPFRYSARLANDIEATRAELEGKGATFSSPITDEGYGLVTMLDVPAADPIMMYQPKHKLAYTL